MVSSKTFFFIQLLFSLNTFYIQWYQAHHISSCVPGWSAWWGRPPKRRIVCLGFCHKNLDRGNTRAGGLRCVYQSCHSFSAQWKLGNSGSNWQETKQIVPTVCQTVKKLTTNTHLALPLSRELCKISEIQMAHSIMHHSTLFCQKQILLQAMWLSEFKSGPTLHPGCWNIPAETLERTGKLDDCSDVECCWE